MKILPWLWLGILASNFVVSSPVKAQITPDGTTNTTVTPLDNGIGIEAGDRAGNNLFHSFEQFSVLNGSEAFFNNANDIVNIFSRVTGGDISNIDGLLRANGGANLFIINPAGIVFDEGASLDIGGSFFASTAESIVFADDVEFSATDTDEPPLLTINQPLGLNLDNNPGDIAVNGSNLQVGNGETLALIGGNVTLTGGQIIAPGANIELGGLTAAGQISFEQLEAISFPETAARGDVTLTDGTEVNVQAAGGGSITVNAGNLEISEASNLLVGIAPESGSTQAQAGDITIDATGDITLTQSSGIRNRVEALATGNGGAIEITANNLSVTEKSQIDANTAGQGNSGKMTINAADTVLLNGLRRQNEFDPNIPPEERDLSGVGTIISQVEKSGLGNSGGIEITTTNLLLNDGAVISSDTIGRGDGGAITIEAFDTIALEGVNPDPPNAGNYIGSEVRFGATGNVGDINLTTTNLSLKDGSSIQNLILGRGDTGAITINVSDTITLEGADRSEQIAPSRIGNGVDLSGTGQGDDINITTANLFLKDGANINASTFGQGDAGTITINASDTITLEGENRNQINAPPFSNIITLVGLPATGKGGNINITTANLLLKDGASINASTFGQGDAGRIDITTTDLLLKDGALIDAATFSEGDAGSITIDASNTISLEGTNSGGSGSLIASDVFYNIDPDGILQITQGNAGEIDITTNNLFLKQGGQILTSTVSLGNAGAVTIDASGTVLVEGEDNNGFNSGIYSFVAAEAQGNAGSIKIDSNDLYLRNGGQVITSTGGLGDAGEIAIKVDNKIVAEGTGTILADVFEVDEFGGGVVGRELRDNSGVFSSVESTGVGNAANINLNAQDLSLVDGAEISVESLGQGEAGNLNIQASSLSLTNDAALFASTPLGTGGNINLQIADELILRDNSRISAQALEDAGGGNINLDAGLVVAFPNQNNDIIASAAQGDGGNINITTNGLFGFSQTSIFNTNNIDASSEFGLDGTININELEVNPAEGLEELPAEVIDVARLVAQTLCQQGRGSEFIVTGKGGIAPSPSQARNGEISEVDLVEPANVEDDVRRGVSRNVRTEAEGRGEPPFAHTAEKYVQTRTKPEIIEAQGWIINNRNILELVADKTDPNSSPPQPEAKICTQ